jgi:hypothetical protein
MSSVNLSSGLPETVLPDPPAAAATALAAAGDDRSAVAGVVAAHPRFLEGWATLGELAAGDVEAYAYFRVGYHRGLDALRGNGWKGYGRVPWEHAPNRGFLRSVHALGRAAAAIEETEEAKRCQAFLAESSATAAAVLG